MPATTVNAKKKNASSDDSRVTRSVVCQNPPTRRPQMEQKGADCSVRMHEHTVIIPDFSLPFFREFCVPWFGDSGAGCSGSDFFFMAIPFCRLIGQD